VSVPLGQPVPLAQPPNFRGKCFKFIALSIGTQVCPFNAYYVSLRRPECFRNFEFVLVIEKRVVPLMEFSFIGRDLATVPKCDDIVLKTTQHPFDIHGRVSIFGELYNLFCLHCLFLFLKIRGLARKQGGSIP
jgi:hypothetical protein